MAGHSNVPNDLQESIRNVLDRHIKLSIRRLVKQEVRPDKWENKVLAFSTSRLFIFTGKAPTKVENSIHYLDIQSVESKKPNQLVLTVDGKPLSFYTMETETEEVDQMISHIGTSLKTTFPAFPLERVISKIEVHPPERLRLMNDMVQNIEKKEMGPCGNFSVMYTCMCEYHNLPYREEVSWDVDTIYLSQDSRELCLRDFDHLNSKDLVPIIAALEHNPWFTSLNASNVYLIPEVSAEILRVMKKNAVIEELLLCNTGINTEFITKLSTAILSNSDTQLHKIDVSNNVLDEKCLVHLVGSLKSRGRCFTYLDLSRTKLSTKGLNKVAEIMSQSPNVFSGLQVLKLAELSSGKSEDLQALYSFLAQPMNITHLDVSGTECALDQLIAPLQRGCSMTVSHLYLARTTFTNKKLKDAQVPPSWKQFFSIVMNLKHLDMSGVKLPAEALKELLLGLGSNRNLSGLHLNISGLDLTNQAFQYLQNCLSAVTTIYSLDVSNTSLNETDLCTLLSCIGQNKEIKHLYIGRLLNNMKPKNLNTVLEGLVHLIQDEDSSLESLSLADSKLKTSMNMIINSLGSNTSLTEIDISGNQMGDLGARMLAKALQINNKLKVINWDNNNTTAQGFEDIAAALEKNYTVKKMPIPVHDASAALKQPERTEAALQKIESLLQRNHSPRKYSSDQAYRLQQGFLISSTQQMVDRRVVQTQDTINALSVESTEAIQDDVDKAKSLIKDADNLKVLLPKLHDIANASQNSGNPVELKLKYIAKELREVLEEHMNKTVSDMVASSCRMCCTVTSDESFLAELKEGCAAKSAIPKDFTSNILDGVDTDIYNKLSELNLAVAAHISDQVIDRVIERLSERNKTLTNHLNQRIKNPFRHSQTKPEKMDNDTEKLEEIVHRPSSSPQESPSIAVMRKSIHERKRRPQSVINREQVTVFLKANSARSEDNLLYHTSLENTSDLDPGLLPRVMVSTVDGAYVNSSQIFHVTSAPTPVLPVIHDKEEDSSNHVIREEDDLVLDLPQEAKLGNYKRAKPPARSRPTVRPTAPITHEKPGDSFKEDEGIDQFFGSTSVPVSAAGSPSPIANKKTPIANPSKSADTKKKSPWPNFNPFGNKEKTEKKRFKLSSRKASETEEEKKKDDKQDNKRGSKPTPPAASAKPKVTNSSQESRKEESVERRPKEFETEVEEEIFEKKEEVLEEMKKTESSVEVKLPQVLEKHANALEKEPGEITKIDGDKMDETKKEQEQPDKEKTEEVAPKVPLVVPKRPGLPGMGFGANIMAQVKAEQEKRKSMIPNTNISLPVKSPASEKEVPLFPRNLKPVNERATVSPQSDERLTQENGSKKSIGDGGPKSPLNKLRVSDKSVPTSTKPLDSVQDIMTKSAEIPKIESCPVKEEKKTIATDDDIEKVKDAPSSKMDIIPPGSQKDSDGSNADSHGKSDQKPPPALRPRPQIKTAKPRSLVEAEVKPNEKEPEKEKQKQTEEKPNKKEHEEKHKHPEEKPNEKESEEKQKLPEEKQNKKEHEEKQKHPEENPNKKEHEEKQKHPKEKQIKKEHEEKQKHPEEKQIKKEHEEKQKHPEGKPNEKEKEEKQKHQESGVVYDSATIRLSLKEKMALFGEQNAEEKHQKPEKSNSLPRGVKPPEQIDEKRPNSMILPTLVKQDIKKNSKKSEEIKVEVKEGKNSASDDDVSSESDSETLKKKSGLRSSASSPDSAECPNRDSSSSEEVIMV